MQHTHFASNLPNTPRLITVRTKEAFNRGYMLNGAHVDDWRKLTVTLDVCLHTTNCHLCKRPIQRGEVIGNGWIFGDGVHCKDCIEDVPAGLEVWELSYPMKRKHIKRTEAYVSTPAE